MCVYGSTSQIFRFLSRLATAESVFDTFSVLLLSQFYSSPSAYNVVSCVFLHFSLRALQFLRCFLYADSLRSIHSYYTHNTAYDCSLYTIVLYVLISESMVFDANMYACMYCMYVCMCVSGFIRINRYYFNSNNNNRRHTNSRWLRRRRRDRAACAHVERLAFRFWTLPHHFSLIQHRVLLLLLLLFLCNPSLALLLFLVVNGCSCAILLSYFVWAEDCYNI